jgi:hypothetical protein
MNEPDPASLEQPPQAPWGSNLFRVGCTIVALAEAYYLFRANAESLFHLIGGLVILLLAFVPALQWARRAKGGLPVFETLLLTSANTYALPLLNGHEGISNYPSETISEAIVGVILFQAAAIFAFQATPARPSSRAFWREEIISKDLGRWMSYGVALNTVYVLITCFTNLVPAQFESILRAIFFGIGIISTFISSRRLGLGELSGGEKIFLIANVLVQCLCMLTSLYLVSTISLLLLALVGYVSASGRLPIIITVACLVFLALLHNGKSPMRTKYWEDGATRPTASQLPAFYSEWINHGLEKSEEAGQKKLTTKLVDRTSLLQMLCLVVNFSPTYQPFLYGETYADIPAQLVPRFLWPNKPLGHVSNSRLSVYYGLQSEEDTLKTTIGFGMVSEAYANFGFYGIGMLGLLIGFSFKKVQSSAEGGPLFSYGGLVLIILLAWSFQVEFTLSIWLASLYQALITVLGVPFVLRHLLGR